MNFLQTKSVKNTYHYIEMIWFPDDLWDLIKEFSYDPQYYSKTGHRNSLAKKYRDCIPIFKGMFSYVTYRQVLLIRPHRPSNREFFALKDTVLYKSIEKAIKEISTFRSMFLPTIFEVHKKDTCIEVCIGFGWRRCHRVKHETRKEKENAARNLHFLNSLRLDQIPFSYVNFLPCRDRGLN